jgi:hypothetical protein
MAPPQVSKPPEIHRELVPLVEAAAATYHIITEKPGAPRDSLELEEVRGRVAIALSSVAPILKQVGDGAVAPLPAAEAEERLFARGSRPRLDGLYVRRVDLLHAVELLKEARVAFDRGESE